MPSANKTSNIGLNQWLGNEYVKRQDFVDDNRIIDEEIGKIKENIENISTDAKGTSFDNSSNGMTATNVQEAIEENKTSILSLQEELGINKSTLESNINSIREVL